MQKSAHEESANQLVKHYYKEIFAFVYKQVMDEQEALDLTQEVCIRMLQSIENYDAGKASFRTWLYRIATNHCIDYFRSKSYKTESRIDYIEDQDVESTENVLEGVLKKEQMEGLQAVLARFDQDTQFIVRYKLFLEQSFREIAVSLNVPESSVKTKYYKAIRTIRKEMEER
ncbi:sigma-70 family RNA polymerase sigma factor [Jeotgalibacillus terrae]|uniref:RNA polymerase sigma factor n=1 Tax=Jeotgalibacillus terrae TaxID=587735 RepID=A0ABW5ZKU1_9BACL|nr:RNA polymerase sigma-70 factor (ECF subfamily) [Jeotgalibacillus terrae]